MNSGHNYPKRVGTATRKYRVGNGGNCTTGFKKYYRRPPAGREKLYFKHCDDYLLTATKDQTGFAYVILVNKRERAFQ